MNAPVDPVYLRRPTETPALRSLRKRVTVAGERCLARAVRATSYDGDALMLRAAQIAAEWQHAPATEDQLEDVIRLLTALNIAANASERLAAPDAE